MDNRITKTRLQSFLSYEWIKVIIFALAIIVAWEFIYAFTSVKLTTGQEFKFYFDQDLSVGDRSDLAKKLQDENGGLSYDVLDVGSEIFTASQNILQYRLQVGDGDVLFVGNITDEETKNNQTKEVNRLNTVIDSYNLYCFEDLLSDCREYINLFLKDGNQTATPSKALIDDQKVERIFRERMKGDNRFRTEEQIVKDGIPQEKKRIEQLISDYLYVKAFVEHPDSKSALYTYTKYRQISELNPDDTVHETHYKDEQAKRNNQDVIYGIDLGKLPQGNGSIDPSTFVKRARKSIDETEDINSADGVVLTVLNFKNEQEHLQYETLTFLRIMLETYSSFRLN